MLQCYMNINLVPIHPLVPIMHTKKRHIHQHICPTPLYVEGAEGDGGIKKLTLSHRSVELKTKAYIGKHINLLFHVYHLILI